MALRHETADDYGRVRALSGRWRVVRCKDDLQLIAQRRVGGSRKWPWQAVAYVLNESALPRVLERASLGIPPEDAEALVAALAREAVA